MLVHILDLLAAKVQKVQWHGIVSLKFLVHFKTDSKFLDLYKDDLSNALEENAEEETPPLTHLLEAFGPGTFATLEEMAR